MARHAGPAHLADAPTLVRHDRTGEPTWFNQLQFHPPSCLVARTREALLHLLSRPESFPRNVVFADDGSTPGDDTVAHIGEVLQRESVGVTLARGEVLVVDNMLVAHSRCPYVGERKVFVAPADSVREQHLPCSARERPEAHRHPCSL
ncbi:hypothetical protein D7V93_35865 [Corallococcus llansteffanensis]|uniref:TauD/TfdA-like domain-containing protein n=2 Tax=Corallococcus llansteffanensis TaxID=2316731 RepID=A0A3A8NXP7_9BACT|nr:hypothetical protein D7V93_35865 [Corallococcus llansteffanensis]